MTRWMLGAALLFACVASGSAIAGAGSSSTRSWNPQTAAAYLDARQGWWMTWPNAARDHDTACVSCHTALSYALARPALRHALGEADLSAPERKMLDNITRRVRLWKDVEPFYPDQTRGLPKTSESRGTEAILNAVILARYDAQRGTIGSDTRQALDNLWPLQFKAGSLAGGWAWLNFGNEPWESAASPYFGAALAAVAVGTAPGYAAAPEVQQRIEPLRAYLQRSVATEPLFNRLIALWASAKIQGLLTDVQQHAIVDTALALQHDDGGWTTASLGPWKRLDGTPLDTASDGYGTGLIAFALQEAGTAPTDAPVARALRWLADHQDRATGMWTATSPNKQRDPASDVGKFLSDAATGFAVLALTDAERSSGQ